MLEGPGLVASSEQVLFKSRLQILMDLVSTCWFFPGKAWSYDIVSVVWTVRSMSHKIDFWKFWSWTSGIRNSFVRNVLNTFRHIRSQSIGVTMMHKLAMVFQDGLQSTY